MLSRALVESLHCPYCGGSLALEKDLAPEDDALGWAITRCACYRYPVVDGILILQQHSPVSSTENALVSYLDSGDRRGALVHALSALSPVSGPRPALQKALTILEQRAGPLGRAVHAWRSSQAQALAETNPTLREALYAFRPARYADYLFFRHANPSFLASLPLLAVFENLSEGLVLDLACGIGHSSYLLSQLFPHLHIVAADHDFLNLYVCKRFIAPGATLVCLNTEAPLPFADHALSGVWCMDGIHYVRSKAALGRELQRATRPDGVWVFPHLHNAIQDNPFAGIPLAPDDYRRCFGGLEPRLFAESAIVQGFVHSQELDLTAPPGEDLLRAAPAVCLVASSQAQIWRRYAALARNLAGLSPLAINPIYAPQGGDSEIELAMAWPSASYEAECAAVKHILPSRPRLERGLFERLRQAQLSGQDRAAVEHLVQAGVVLPVPPGYV